MTKYTKAITMVLVTVASALVGVMTDNVITDVEWVNVAIAGVGALVVFTAPNVPHAPITKFIVAALMAVLTLLASLITDGLTGSEALQLLIAAAGALGVYAFKNTDPEVISGEHLRG